MGNKIKIAAVVVVLVVGMVLYKDRFDKKEKREKEAKRSGAAEKFRWN